MKRWIVYVHIFPNGKKYFGITSKAPQARWEGGSGYGDNQPVMQAAIAKYGWENIEHKVLYENLTKEEAEQKEIELIAFYKSNQRKYGYNICSGGQGTPNHIVSKEIRIKISENTKKAMNNPNIKEKLKQCHLGKTLSEEHKAKIRLSARKYQTEKTKEKMREINKNKIKVKCIETGVVYDSIHDASRITNIAYQNIYKVCKNIRKKAGGYCWKYEY